MHLRSLFVSIVLFAACGSSKEGDGGGGGEKPKATSGRPTNTDVPSLFTGTTVTLPPEVAKASFDGKKADVLKVVGTESGYMTSKTHAKVDYDLNFTRADNLEKITVTTRGVALEPILTKQWGPPIKAGKGDKVTAFWFNPEAGLRAWLPDHAKGEAVAFSRYEALSTLLGPKGFELAFTKGKPLFGATLDELHAGWGAKLCDWERQSEKMKKAYEENVKDSIARIENHDLQLKLCPGWARTTQEYSPSGDTIRMGVDQKAYAISMSFSTGGSPEMSAQIVKELDAKFGTPTIVSESETSVARYYFDSAGTAKMRAKVTVGPDWIGLDVGPYLPIAELIGDASTPGLTIETPSIIGGTIEQISKEAPAHIRHSGTLHDLVFAPTEFSSSQTEVDLNQWDRDPKTYGYRVVVHHTNYEKAGDDLYALLVAKYGEPKKTEGEDKDKTFSFVKGNRKLAARRVSQQWQLSYTK